MAETPKLHDEMLEQAMAYYGGDLSPEEAAQFEAHLATCPGCQEALRMAKAALPLAEQLLAFKAKHTIDEQVKRFEALVEEKRRAESRARTSRLRLWLGLAFGTAVAAAATFALMRIGPNVPLPNQVYAPEPPQTPDAGLDGGR